MPHFRLHFPPFNSLGAEKNPFKHGNSRDARSLRPLQMAPLRSNSTASPTPDARAVRPYRHRTHLPALCLFSTPDPKAHKTPDVSPYLYCAANPIIYTDPTGKKVEGVTKNDAALVVQDFRAMFPGDEFAEFRKLIVQSGKKQNGKALAKISSEALSSAFNGVTLNEDQKALVDMTVNTINSDDIHKVEYTSNTGVLSKQAEASFLPGFLSGEIGPHMPEILEANGGFPLWLVVNEGGGGVTTQTKNGSHSLIILGGDHPNGRAVTTGHEILGHGRSWATGMGDSHQHVQAIRTENLILRVMGIPYINTGENHAPNGAFPECSLLPNFR